METITYTQDKLNKLKARHKKKVALLKKSKALMDEYLEDVSGEVNCLKVIYENMLKHLRQLNGAWVNKDEWRFTEACNELRRMAQWTWQVQHELGSDVDWIRENKLPKT